jgi:hypothetical protein
MIPRDPSGFHALTFALLRKLLQGFCPFLGVAAVEPLQPFLARDNIAGVPADIGVRNQHRRVVNELCLQLAVLRLLLKLRAKR